MQVLYEVNKLKLKVPVSKLQHIVHQIASVKFLTFTEFSFWVFRFVEFALQIA